MTRFHIVLSDGTSLEVEDGFGPLGDFDAENGDPTDGASAIWKAIHNQWPIWVRHSNVGRVWYLNAAHVVAVMEIPR